MESIINESRVAPPTQLGRFDVKSISSVSAAFPFAKSTAKSLSPVAAAAAASSSSSSSSSQTKNPIMTKPQRGTLTQASMSPTAELNSAGQKRANGIVIKQQQQQHPNSFVPSPNSFFKSSSASPSPGLLSSKRKSEQNLLFTAAGMLSSSKPKQAQQSTSTISRRTQPSSSSTAAAAASAFPSNLNGISMTLRDLFPTSGGHLRTLPTEERGEAMYSMSPGRKTAVTEAYDHDSDIHNLCPLTYSRESASGITSATSAAGSAHKSVRKTAATVAAAAAAALAVTAAKKKKKKSTRTGGGGITTGSESADVTINNRSEEIPSPDLMLFHLKATQKISQTELQLQSKQIDGNSSLQQPYFPSNQIQQQQQLQQQPYFQSPLYHPLQVVSQKKSIASPHEQSLQTLHSHPQGSMNMFSQQLSNYQQSQLATLVSKQSKTFAESAWTGTLLQDDVQQSRGIRQMLPTSLSVQQLLTGQMSQSSPRYSTAATVTSTTNELIASRSYGQLQHQKQEKPQKLTLSASKMLPVKTSASIKSSDVTPPFTCLISRTSRIASNKHTWGRQEDHPSATSLAVQQGNSKSAYLISGKRGGVDDQLLSSQSERLMHLASEKKQAQQMQCNEGNNNANWDLSESSGGTTDRLVYGSGAVEKLFYKTSDCQKASSPLGRAAHGGSREAIGEVTDNKQGSMLMNGRSLLGSARDRTANGSKQSEELQSIAMQRGQPDREVIRHVVLQSDCTSTSANSSNFLRTVSSHHHQQQAVNNTSAGQVFAANLPLPVQQQEQRQQSAPRQENDIVRSLNELKEKIKRVLGKAVTKQRDLQDFNTLLLEKLATIPL